MRSCTMNTIYMSSIRLLQEKRRNSTLLRRRWELRPFNEITPIPRVDLLRKVTLELRVCIR